MLKHNYFMNKKTGELLTYSEAFNEFYKIKRGVFENIFDEYIETDMQSEEVIEKPNFLKTIKQGR